MAWFGTPHLDFARYERPGTFDPGRAGHGRRRHPPLALGARGWDRAGMTAFAFAGAALAEIAGCFAFWAWLRLGRSVWWTVPGVLSLCLFAWLLTLPDSNQAGRSYAAYGGVYIATAVLWLWLAEGAKPDRWDLLGAGVCLAGSAIIYFGPRGG